MFSDVDGTLVHLPRALEPLGSFSPDGLRFEPTDGEAIAIRPLPPSSTGVQGYISERTLELVAELRRAGHRFVLISGARSTTVFERLPFLPAADAYVAENGGRVFMPVPASRALTAAPIEEDMQWRWRHAAAGPPTQGGLPPEERAGELWDLFRSVQQDGWAVDARSYSTSFRISLSRSPNKTAEDLLAMVRDLPPTLASSYNLGAADFYPATSGKDMAAQHLMRKFGVDSASCVSMGDDDNDLGLAAVVRHTYITDFTADTVREAVAADPAAFTVAERRGFAATEDLLTRITADFGSQSSVQSRVSRSLIPAVVLMFMSYAWIVKRRNRRHGQARE